jgi:hypothetical protein
MEIKINDKALDISLENENTLGEVLAGLEEWLSGSGNRICELKIDGETVTSSMIEEAFKKDVKTVKSLDISTNAIAELCAASLLNLIEDIKEFEGLNFEEKGKYCEKWRQTVTAHFISSEMGDLYSFCCNVFTGGDVTPQTLLAIVEEIQREVNDPKKELIHLEPILNEISVRLADLPLDIQTGKDARAAQTIQLFSAITEKIYRILKQLDTQGYLSREVKGQDLGELMTNFGNVLKELLDAYEKNDSVLVGDLTEYEASPKIKELYKAILENVHLTEKEKGEKC